MIGKSGDQTYSQQADAFALDSSFEDSEESSPEWKPSKLKGMALRMLTQCPFCIEPRMTWNCFFKSDRGHHGKFLSVYSICDLTCRRQSS